MWSLKTEKEINKKMFFNLFLRPTISLETVSK